MPKSDYVVNLIVKTEDKTSGPSKQAKQSILGLKSAFMGLVAVKAAQWAIKTGVELAKTGAAAERQSTALDNLASAAGTSGDAIVKSIQEASSFTIDRMTAMQAANRAMIMDVAQTPEQFEKLTRVATALGRAMGQDATKSIDDFVTAAGRQSKLIADNLGLVVNAEDAYARYAVGIGKTADQLTDAEKKQAFLNEMLVQGEAKMADLGEQTLDAAGSFEQFSAAAADAKTSFGIIVSTLLQSTGIVQAFAKQTRQAADSMTAVAEAGGPNLKLYNQAWRESMFTLQSAEDVQQRYIQLLQLEARAAVDAAEGQSYRSGETAKATYEIADATGKAAESFRLYSWAIETGELRQDRAAMAAMDLARATEEATVATSRMAGPGDFAAVSIERMGEAARKTNDDMVRMNQTTLELSMQFTRQFSSMEEASADLAARREQAEANHQERLAAIRQRGQARAIEIDEAAERNRLAQLQRNMEIALQQEAEFTDKTKASTQMRKQDQIAEIQTQITAQEQLLDDYASGRLVKAGANVDALIAEEQRRHDATIANLEKEMTKQEQVQQQALGNMTLQAFDAWAKNQEAMERGLDPQKLIEMRTKIAEEFGLVKEGAADLITDMMGEWDRWAEDQGKKTDEIVGYIGNVLDATGDLREELIELTAETYWIRVRYDQQGMPTDIPGATGPGLSGGGIPSQTINNADTYNFYTSHGPAAVLESQRRARRQQMGRIM